MATSGGIHLEVEFTDHSQEYLAQLNTLMSDGMQALGTDLQRMAQGAAPEKTGHLVDHIVMKSSMAHGAYQAELESTASEGNHDYVVWMHNGEYRLGKYSRMKAGGVSAIAGVRRDVGPGYLISAGEDAQAGYQKYLMQQVDGLNSRWK